MNDQFLRDHQREPRPEFANRLRNGLGREDESRARAGFRHTPALAATFAVILAVGAFAFPAVRAAAQSFLELFRIRQFTAVSFDPARLEKLRGLDKNGALLVFDEHTVLREPGPERVFTTVEEASAATGLSLRRPTYFVREVSLAEVRSEGEGEVRFTMHGAKLRPLLDQIGLSDVSIPPDFDGQPITVRKPVVVTQHYKNASGSHRVDLTQARYPEVGLPPGADLSRLGEVGLRVLGLDAFEARRIAGSIDWRSTLVVPVPLNASTFRPVTIRGRDGLLVTTSRRSEDGSTRDGSIVMWSEGEQLFALTTNLGGPDAVVMAESVQ
jgi:hypothetical protein